MANFSNIYQSGNDGLQQYINRNAERCYVYRFKFDRDKHVVLYNRGVFLLGEQLNSTVENGTTLCYPCPERETMNAGPRICRSENVTLYLAEYDKHFKRYYGYYDYDYNGYHFGDYCVGGKSR